MNVQTESWIKKLGTDALILGSVTVFGYAIAYLFEMGVARHFGFPRSLIEPTTATLASSWVFISIITYALAPMLIFGSNAAAPGADNRLPDYLFFVSLFVLWCATSGMSEIDWKSFAWGGFAAFIYFGQLWGQHLCRNNPPRLLKLRASVFKVACLVLIMDLVVGSINLGSLSGQMQEKFAFLKNSPEFAVVRVYNGTMIAMKYDPKSKMFLDEFRLIKLNDDKDGMDFVMKRSPTTRPLRFE